MSADELTVWYGCQYAPVELFAGYGVACAPLNAALSTFDAADSLASPNLCGYGKTLLGLALRPEVDCLVLTDCCDVIRRVYEILARERSFTFLWMLDLPHKSGPAEIARWRRELARMANAFEETTGRTFDIAQAVSAFEPPLPMLQPHVSLLGAHAPADVVDAAEAALSWPVENLTCTGARRIASPPPQLLRAPRETACDACCDVAAEDPAAAPSRDSGGTTSRDLGVFLDWYAGALLTQTPCMRMDNIDARQDLVGAPNQLGVIYHTMKFCDFYSFEYADLCRIGGIPMVKIETDATPQSAGQLRTRLEAFGETVASHDENAAAHERNAAPDTAGSHKPSGGRCVVGVDSGSTSTDAAVLDLEGNLLGGSIMNTGAKASVSAQTAIDEALREAGMTRDDVALYVSTGYGRDAVEGMDAIITEITCHARGAHHLAPSTRTVIDIGGQDSKVIHLDEQGGVTNFVMNDKCAAGTGRFLETMARTLEMPIEELSRIGLTSNHAATISSMCTVFAESEVVSLVADDTPTADIVRGLCMSVASKTASLAHRVGAEPAYLMTGGVANNAGVVEALSEVLGAPIATDPNSQLCGAIGAALLGLDRLKG